MATAETPNANYRPQATFSEAQADLVEQNGSLTKKARNKDFAEEARTASAAEQWKTASVREYFERTVNPILLQGMQHIARYRPEDPLDALADFLKQNNPKKKSSIQTD